MKPHIRQLPLAADGCLRYAVHPHGRGSFQILVRVPSVAMATSARPASTARYYIVKALLEHARLVLWLAERERDRP